MAAFMVSAGLAYWLSFLLALVGMGLFGLVFNYGVYYPLRHRGFLPVIISTLGASIFLQNTVLAIFGAQPKRLDNVVAGGLQIGSGFLASQVLAILGLTLGRVAFPYVFFGQPMLRKTVPATAPS